MAVRVLSVIDALSFPESKEVVVSGDEGRLKEMLFEIGMDVYGWGLEYQVCLHRPMVSPNEVVYTGRWMSMERADVDWLNSGYCSEEKRREALYRKDSELVRDLEAMSQEAVWTSLLIEHLEEHFGLRNE